MKLTHERVPHTVRLTHREKVIIRELIKRNVARTTSGLIRDAIQYWGGYHGIETDESGRIV